jgi:AcrR family transcriptional regulator
VEELKKKILDTSKALFRKFGTRSITMDEIASELGISKKTIYQAFKDKNEIIQQMMLRYVEEESQMILNARDGTKDAVEEVVKISYHIVNELKNINPIFIYDLRKYHREAWEMHESHQIDIITKNVNANIIRGIKEGLYHNDFDVELLVRLRLAEFEILTNEKYFPKDKYKIFDLHLFLLEHFLRGILTPLGMELYQFYKKNNLSNI